MCKCYNFNCTTKLKPNNGNLSFFKVVSYPDNILPGALRLKIIIYRLLLKKSFINCPHSSSKRPPVMIVFGWKGLLFPATLR